MFPFPPPPLVMSSLPLRAAWAGRIWILPWCSTFLPACRELLRERKNDYSRSAERSVRKSRGLAPHAPADGGHPPIRGPGQRSLYASADARPGASLHRRGGG